MTSYQALTFTLLLSKLKPKSFSIRRGKFLFEFSMLMILMIKILFMNWNCQLTKDFTLRRQDIFSYRWWKCAT